MQDNLNYLLLLFQDYECELKLMFSHQNGQKNRGHLKQGSQQQAIHKETQVNSKIDFHHRRSKMSSFYLNHLFALIMKLQNRFLNERISFSINNQFMKKITTAIQKAQCSELLQKRFATQLNVMVKKLPGGYFPRFSVPSLRILLMLHLQLSTCLLRNQPQRQDYKISFQFSYEQYSSVERKYKNPTHSSNEINQQKMGYY
ncbi:unnamed protein product [Paramecium pentaurelia]|uniref:Uncharacterized protein n=1 Tax=Paramecium pentaurelia TaxID=43138 RepID=A0A8S1VZB3_9CILI|nr:unnamed protein product [Paramecium pentaurelia]